MYDIDQSISQACAEVPGRMSGALVLLPDGIQLGGFGEGGVLGREPLARSAARCLGSPPVAVSSGKPALNFAEYAFVSAGELVVILRGKRFQHVALAVCCSREANLALVMNTSRRALGQIEAGVDLGTWKV
jgi:hypothetical protein